MTYNAKSVIANKFWIVESNGEKLGTLKCVQPDVYEFFINRDQSTTVLTENN